MLGYAQYSLRNVAVLLSPDEINRISSEKVEGKVLGLDNLSSTFYPVVVMVDDGKKRGVSVDTDGTYVIRVSRRAYEALKSKSSVSDSDIFRPGRNVVSLHKFSFLS